MTGDFEDSASCILHQPRENLHIELANETPDFKTALNSAFGLNEFRAGQLEIISAIHQGEDVMAVLPTGGGKSLCFQLPSVLQNGLVIVISPLIALMRDQVQALQARGIAAGFLASGQTEEERRDVFRRMSESKQFLLYLSPERAQKEGFKQWIQNRRIVLFAVDEAHCVSQWGHDFREEYGQLSVLKQLRPDVPILALTASATPEVLFDISKQLKLKNPKKMVYGFYRPNLYYQVEVCGDDSEKRRVLRAALRKFNQGRVLIYCGTRRVTEELAEELSDEFPGVGHYHAGLSHELRNLAQEKYLEGETRILVATNAFGMGIDQPDVRLVVHFQMPANIDSLYQEMGRAGRDQMPSTCLLLYSRKDKGLQSFFIQQSEAPQAIRNSRYRNLDTLVDYCEGSECRHGEILTYYRDQQRIQSCGHCDVCDPTSERRVVAVKEVAVDRDSTVTQQRSAAKTKRTKKAAEVHLEGADLVLFEDLRKWRKSRAQELDVPAFVILSDRTLRGIASRRPSTLEALAGVYGIGQAKLEQFGSEILQVVSGLSSSTSE